MLYRRRHCPLLPQRVVVRNEDKEMNRYIKLEDAISVCREKQIIEGSAVTGIRYPRPDEIIYDLSELPVIDIVYCVECRYKDMIICPMHNLTRAGVLQPHDFCSYGDRRKK